MWSVDGTFYRFCVWITRHLLLNLAFIVGSLPILTVGGSLAGLFSAVRGSNNSTATETLRSFVRGFRANFWQGSWFGLLLAAFAWLWRLDFVVISRTPGHPNTLVVISLYGIGALVVAAGLYVYPMLVSMALPSRRIAKNALILVAVKPLYTVGNLIVLGLLFYASEFVPPLFFGLFFSVGAMATTWFFQQKVEAVVAGQRSHGADTAVSS